jgi:hypothetical protein
MGVMDMLRHGRREQTIAENREFSEKHMNVTGASDSESDTLSVEARDQKEVENNPNQVTANAQLGVQKAEAAALVWSKKAVYATYGW